MSVTTSIDVAIVGAGVIGLSIAKVLKTSFPHWEIALFDKMPHVGEHASGRNSGVLHAGLYYPQDSLKKRFCVEGLARWNEWAQDIGTEILHCGKFITAEKVDEKRLINLYQRALNSGVELRWASDEEIKSLKDFVKLDLAFFSTQTSVVDPSELLSRLQQRVESLGVHLLLQHEVLGIKQESSKYRLHFTEYDVQSKYLINAAGAGAISLRKLLGLKDLEDYWVKGAYLKTFKSFYHQSLIYTLPLENLKGLGVHTCIDFDGTVKFGPNAIDCHQIDYSLSEEEVASLKKEVLDKFKLSEADLHIDYSGIRSKIRFKGESFADFWIKTPFTNYVELCGIESPGLTSAPAIAEYVKSCVTSFEHSK